ncbi:MAG: signal peptidase I [Clostridia bacterium]|jgi:signal peptidase I|nr:signal peptidase I [Clostridia bacterium]MCI1999960.1 signal peptidase I [Clostridia bacterium]MCI2014506.1 signal peptidase I [Clostridia bacterium]
MDLRLLKKIGSEILETAVIVLVFFYAFFPASVNGTSMSNTLNNGDKIFMCRLISMFGKCSTGDIVVLKLNIDGKNTKIVKRIAAQSGDTIEIKERKLYINGIEKKGYYFKKGTEDTEFVLGNGYIYALGDNAGDSTDSRDFGPLNCKSIEGKVLMSFTPFRKITFFK